MTTLQKPPPSLRRTIQVLKNVTRMRPQLKRRPSWVTVVAALIIPAILTTVSVPAYAAVDEEPIAPPAYAVGAQSLSVGAVTQEPLIRDLYSATTPEELQAARDAAAAAEAAARAAEAAAQAAVQTQTAREASKKKDRVITELQTSTGWIRPVPGKVTSGYGPRGLICNSVGCSNSFHEGIDFGNDCGTPIQAAAGGQVTFVGSAGSYGNRVIIDHGNGTESVYGHIQSGSFEVTVGQVIPAGTIIASVGATGVVSGCHLDLKILIDGKSTDPAAFLRQHGVKL